MAKSVARGDNEFTELPKYFRQGVLYVYDFIVDCFSSNIRVCYALTHHFACLNTQPHPILVSNWETHDNAYLARPYNSSEFNLIHGIFRLPNTFRAFFEIERSPDHTDFLVDNVSFKRMVCDPQQLLLNGDFEEPKTKYWDTWGGDVSLGLVAGYGGKGQALKAFTRPHLSHGPAQVCTMKAA